MPGDAESVKLIGIFQGTLVIVKSQTWLTSIFITYSAELNIIVEISKKKIKCFLDKCLSRLESLV